jgi:hypothetical protein
VCGEHEWSEEEESQMGSRKSGPGRAGIYQIV